MYFVYFTLCPVLIFLRLRPRLWVLRVPRLVGMLSNSKLLRGNSALPRERRSASLRREKRRLPREKRRLPRETFNLPSFKQRRK